MTRLIKLLNISKDLKNSKLYSYIQLSKPGIIFPVTLTCFTACFLVRPVINSGIILVSLGVLFLAAAASALNQIQEVHTDSKMERTRYRPLPSGKLSRNKALVFAFLCFLAGSLLLWFYSNPLALFLGWFNIFWYNVVYTFLKRKTAFAVIPGSLTGAIPPLIGWVAAGGNLFDKTAILLAFVFFMAQVPHFWILIIKYGEEYSRAGLPNLTAFFSKGQIKRLSYVWIVSALVSALILTQFGLNLHPLIKISVFVITSLLLLFFSLKSLTKDDNYPKNHFIVLNSYFLVLMLLFISGRII